jgi:hypothetical protein
MLEVAHPHPPRLLYQSIALRSKPAGLPNTSTPRSRLPPCRSWKPNRSNVRPVRARKESNIPGGPEMVLLSGSVSAAPGARQPVGLRHSPFSGPTEQSTVRLSDRLCCPASPLADLEEHVGSEFRPLPSRIRLWGCTRFTISATWDGAGLWLPDQAAQTASAGPTRSLTTSIVWWLPLSSSRCRSGIRGLVPRQLQLRR